jgi:hypothetical protein
MVRIGDWDYPNDVMETVKINKKIKQDFSIFCKSKSINKSKLIEEFYKSILIKFRDGSMNASGGNITMNIFNKITPNHR